MKTKITMLWAILFSCYSFGQVGTIFYAGGLKYKITAATTVEVGQDFNLTGYITIPENVKYENVNYQVTRIANGGFKSNFQIYSVIIPQSVASIGSNAFLGCLQLNLIIIPNSVTSIDELAFSDCESLTSVTIPNSVNSIGASAFKNCSGLKSVTVYWQTPLSINANVFEIVPTAKVILYVPAGTETAYKNALVWKEFGTITLGANDFSLDTNVKFYPNPTKSQINFSQEINSLEVFDIAGRKVKSFQKPNATYDVSTLEKGIYILKGATAVGNSINEKLIKE